MRYTRHFPTTSCFPIVVAAIFLLAFSSTPVVYGQDTAAQNGDWEDVYLANYVETEDLPLLRKLGVNTVLMEFDKNADSWRQDYDAAISQDIKVVPVLWGKAQSVWKWNKKSAEWELDAKKYPKSVGAKFLKFLKEEDAYRKQTFAVYSFHEPWYIPDNGKRKGTVSPQRQRKFWTQIKAMFDGSMKVYGEEVTWVPECKNGCVDYDYITLYSFATCDGKTAYRPGGRFQVGDVGLDGSQAPCEIDRQKAKQKELEQIRLMSELIATAPPAADGTRTKLIALMGTFAHDEEPDLWNRMPSVKEMNEWGRDIIVPSKQRLAGMGWYAFRNPTTYYKNVLFNSRKDDEGADRWEAIRSVYETVYQPAGVSTPQ